MANYYYVRIENENVNQELAAKILARFATSCRVRHFSFCEGCISYNTRSLIDIRDIIEEYGIDEEEVDVVDEFELVEEGVVMPRRSEQELIDYEKEAFDKVWLMRTSPVEPNEFRTPEVAREIETRRQAAVERILDTYDDIPEEGYNDWECGFWNGVMATCRWALGDEEKDNLDT